MDKETIKKARQANLAEYLLSVGVPLVKNGNRYRHKEHNSLTFTENAYYWNSKQEHGNAIDYLVDHLDMDFKSAVYALVNMPSAPMSDHDTPKPAKTKGFNFDKIQFADNTDKARAYLIKTRYISNGVIDYLVRNALLFQEPRTNNTFFPIYDEHGECVGGERQGITAKRFKGTAGGSKYGYGFNIQFPDQNGGFDYALFFESAVDLISFLDYKQNHEEKSLDRCILVSMAGLKINILRHTLKVFSGNPKPIICTDNDPAGVAFLDELKTSGISCALRLPDDEFKDWNEQLTAIKKSVPLSRLKKHQRNSDIIF